MDTVQQRGSANTKNATLLVWWYHTHRTWTLHTHAI